MPKRKRPKKAKNSARTGKRVKDKGVFGVIQRLAIQNRKRLKKPKACKKARAKTRSRNLW